MSDYGLLRQTRQRARTAMRWARRLLRRAWREDVEARAAREADDDANRTAGAYGTYE